MSAKIIKSRYTPTFVTFLIFISLILPFYIMAGCSTVESSESNGNNSAEIEQMYLNAVNDARTAEYSEISKNLTAINKYNPNLVWEGEAGDSRILMLTWTSGDYYDDSVGDDYYLPVNVWVTVSPELKNYFSEHGYSSGEITSLKIEQLLGVPPNSGKTKFIEIWADPVSLFRPSPDPEITDSQAELDFTPDKFRVYSDTITIKEGDNSYTYKDWFNYLRSTSYNTETPYPWTRLGYTYNWGDTENHVGLSEFVIKSDSTVGIKSVTSTMEYFEN